MVIHCPACKKENEDAGNCTRCGCQLSELIAVIEGAEEHLSLGRDCLVRRDWHGALRHADRSWRLAHTTESAQLACLAAVGSQDLGQLSVWRHRAALRA